MPDASGDATLADAPDGGDVDAPDGALIDAGAIGTCDPTRVRPRGDPPTSSGICTSDEECTDGVNGRCSRFGTTNLCTYDQCFTDADCREGFRCACDAGHQLANVCVEDHCDSCAEVDCAVSWGCEGPHHNPPYGAVALECHTPEDECRTKLDCPAFQFCTRGPGSPGEPLLPYWRCSAVMCD